MYPQTTRTDIHNEKFRNRSKYQTDMFYFSTIMSSPTQNIKTELSTTSTVQTHCPI